MYFQSLTQRETDQNVKHGLVSGLTVMTSRTITSIAFMAVSFEFIEVALYRGSIFSGHDC
jgi:hypothetical protein